jgi:DNA-binding transcriptional LysR family regulator
MTRLQDLNWESVRIFVRLVRAGSFRSAAAELGTATNTVRRQVELLERDAGHSLVTRGVAGVELTPEGRRVFEAALRMEQASFEVQRHTRQGFSQLTGTVRISVTEGIGTFWVMPRLVEFQRAHPKLIVELNCTMRPSDPARLEADIGVQISRPTNPELKAVRLGRMHAMPFASREYLQTYGRPRSIDEVKRHRIVEQLSPQLYNEKVGELFPDVPREGFVAVVTNTSTAHYWAVAKGAGLGMLPTYLWAVGARVEPVDIGLVTEFDIWMTYHPSTRRTARVATTIQWLKSMFDPKTFPWFRDEFIHPDELKQAASELAGPNIFDGFAGRTTT